MDTKMNDQWPSEEYKDYYLHTLLRDTAGFGAAKAIRRVIGLAHVPDMWEIPDERVRAVAESIALQAAEGWMINRHAITSIKELTEIIRKAAPHPQVYFNYG